MQSTWIVVADSSRARIFERQEPEHHLHEIDDFLNLGGRAENNELRSDEGGRFYGKGEGFHGHSAEPAVSPVEHENDMFSRTITQYLDKGRNEHRYEHLYLIAEPQFLGLLRNNMDKEVKKMVEEEVSKNISTMSAREIEDYVNQRIDRK